MNWRLITSSEKRENQRGRNRRNAQRQARKRRARLLAEVLAAAGSEPVVITQLISASGSLDLLTGHLLRAKAVAKALTRALRPPSPGLQVERVFTSEPAARPERSLRLSNRSTVLPWLVEEEQPDVGKTLEEAIHEARHSAEEGASTGTIVDKFARSTQFPMETALRVLRRTWLMEGEFTAETMAAIGQARRFWQIYSEGRRTFLTALLAGETTAHIGDWALIRHQSLMDLLPGIRLPRNLRRPEYLTNLHRGCACWCLDIHSFPSKLPLIRHPFGQPLPELMPPKSASAAE